MCLQEDPLCVGVMGSSAYFQFFSAIALSHMYSVGPVGQNWWVGAGFLSILGSNSLYNLHAAVEISLKVWMASPYPNLWEICSFSHYYSVIEASNACLFLVSIYLDFFTSKISDGFKNYDLIAYPVYSNYFGSDFIPKMSTF